MGHQVFISYASEDKAHAIAVCELLEGHGVSCWMAHRNIPPGVVWPRAISDAIDSASLMLLLISTNANSSRHIGREVERADRKQLPVIPLRIEDVLPTEGIGYFISNVQWIDIFPEDLETYWPTLSFAINQELARGQQSRGQIFPVAQTNVFVTKDKARSFWTSLDPTKKIAAAIGGFVLVVGVAAGLVSQVRPLRDGICKLKAFDFCDATSLQDEDAERRRLDSAEFDATALKALVRDTKTPAVRKEAQRRLDVVMAEQKGYESVENDIDGLMQFLSKPCEACLVKDQARDRLNDLLADREQESGRVIASREKDHLDRAEFDEAELKALARDAKTPAVRNEAQRRLDVILVEQKSYEFVADDIDGLKRFLAKACEACLVQDRAKNRLRTLAADRDRSQNGEREVTVREKELLDRAKYNETELNALAADATTPAVRKEAQRRLDVIANERKRYEAVKNDRAGLSKFVTASCEACVFQAEARAQLEKLQSTSEPPKAATSQPLGYVMFAVIDKDNNLRKKYFEIDGKPKARFPAPNDIISVVNDRGITMRAVPFHWDAGQGKSIGGSGELTEIQFGQKVQIAGDLFVSTDLENGEQYAIAPVSKLLDTTVPRPGKVYSPHVSTDTAMGYVYIGYIDENSNRFRDNSFKNETRPSALYPAPNDILVAVKNVSLRAGPRRWDPAKQTYVDGKVIKTISQGQRVSVAGDAILAKGGLSIWSPISALP